MAVYTRLKKSEIKQLAAEFELEMLSYEEVEHGASNSNYLLQTTEGNYMLTVVEDRNLEETLQLVHLLQWLKKHDFRTTPIRKTKKGELTSHFEKKPVFVKKYISGEVIFDLNSKKLRQIGTRLGLLHQIPAPDFLATSHFYESPLFNKVIGVDIDGEYESWLKDRLNYFEAALPQNMPRGLIHGDVFPDNVLFKNKKVKALIDFEEACNYFLVYDLGMILLGLCAEGYDFNFKSAKAIMKGYQKIRPLKKKERKHLKAYTEYAAIRTSNWRFWKYHISAPNPERANKHREMMGVAEKLRHMKRKDFLKKVF